MTGYLRRLRPIRDVVICLAAYALLRTLALHLLGDAGVLTPKQSVEPWRLAAAFTLLVTRLTILIGVPLVLGYRLAAHSIPRLAARFATRLRAR